MGVIWENCQTPSCYFLPDDRVPFLEESFSIWNIIRSSSYEEPFNVQKMVIFKESERDRLLVLSNPDRNSIVHLFEAFPMPPGSPLRRVLGYDRG